MKNVSDISWSMMFAKYWPTSSIMLASDLHTSCDILFDDVFGISHQVALSFANDFLNEF